MLDSVTIRVAGEGGEGVISTGEMLTDAMVRTQHDVYTFRTYPAEIKGGPAMLQLRTADHPVLSVGTKLDILVAFNEEAVALHSQDLKPEGFLLYDSSTFNPEHNVPSSIHLFGAPFTDIAVKVVGLKLSKNMVALAIMGQILGVPLEDIITLAREKFSSKGEAVLEKNISAVQEGYRWSENHPIPDDFKVPGRVLKMKKLVMSGNEAMAAGAIAAGCRFYAGYPITPASDILSFLEKELPRFGGTAVQTEDEIAAICSCIGASYAGAMSLTATSGPGLSLMAEALGLSSMTETPIVIIDAQRSGPSTGMPTKTEQSDLMFAVHMGHGDAPRVVMAPSNVKDCFYGMVRAFYIAEKYQIPVVMLSDQSLSQRTQTFTRPALKNIPMPARIRATRNGTYKRFIDTETGVSPIAIPGDEGLNFVTTGLEHDEYGHPSWSPSNHQQMSAKRHRKLGFIAKEKGFTFSFGDEDATVGVICWGSTEGPVREAIQAAQNFGFEVKGLTLKMLNPLPDEEIRSFLTNVKQVLVPETNFTGQLCQILRARYLFPFQSYTKCQGVPFTPDEILTRLEEVIRRA